MTSDNPNETFTVPAYLMKMAWEQIVEPTDNETVMVDVSRRLIQALKDEITDGDPWGDESVGIHENYDAVAAIECLALMLRHKKVCTRCDGCGADEEIDPECGYPFNCAVCNGTGEIPA